MFRRNMGRIFLGMFMVINVAILLINLWFTVTGYRIVIRTDPGVITADEKESIVQTLLLLLERTESTEKKLEAYLNEEAEFRAKYEKNMKWIEGTLDMHEDIMKTYSGVFETTQDAAAFGSVAVLVGWTLTNYLPCDQITTETPYSYFRDTNVSYCFTGFRPGDYARGVKGPNPANGRNGYYLVQKKIGFRYGLGANSESKYYEFLLWSRDAPLPEVYWDGVTNETKLRDHLNDMLGLPKYLDTIFIIGESYETVIEVWPLTQREWDILKNGGPGPGGSNRGLRQITP